MSPEPFVSRAKALPAKRSEKAMGMRMGTYINRRNARITAKIKQEQVLLS